MEIEKLVLLLVGGGIGFIASIAKDYFVEKTKKKYKDIDFKREKLEELFIMISKTCNESFKPIESRNYSGNEEYSIKSSLITRFYFPSIHEKVERYIAAYIEFNKKHKSFSNDEKESFLKEYDEVIDIIVLESEKYIVKIKCKLK